MKAEEAIERLQAQIEYKEEWMEFWKEKGVTDYRLRDTELDLEMLRVAVRALERKPRWIPCAERLPEMHEESDFVLFCDITGIHIGYCEVINNDLVWKTADGQIYNDVAAWMLPPKMYVYEED